MKYSCVPKHPQHPEACLNKESVHVFQGIVVLFQKFLPLKTWPTCFSKWRRCEVLWTVRTQQMQLKHRHLRRPIHQVQLRPPRKRWLVKLRDLSTHLWWPREKIVLLHLNSPPDITFEQSTWHRAPTFSFQEIHPRSVEEFLWRFQERIPV